jgi:hypothetical protein
MGPSLSKRNQESDSASILSVDEGQFNVPDGPSPQHQDLCADTMNSTPPLRDDAAPDIIRPPNSFKSREDCTLYFSTRRKVYATKSLIMKNQRDRYNFRCKNLDCTLNIIYGIRYENKQVSKFCLVEHSVFHHVAGCPYSPERFSFDPTEIAEEFADLFTDQLVSTRTLAQALKIKYPDHTFMESDVIYIRRKILEKVTCHGANFKPLVEFHSILKSNGWSGDVDFEGQMLTTITFFPPWAPQIIAAYPSPIITDATFSSDELTLTVSSNIDGENHSQLTGIAVRLREDHVGYSSIFKFHNSILDSIHETTVTVMSDEGASVPPAIEESFTVTAIHVLCCFHLWETIKRMSSAAISKNLARIKPHFFATAYGKFPFETFMNEVSEAEHEADGPVHRKLFNTKQKWCPSFFDPHTHRRLNITTQRAEMINNIMKSKAGDVLSALKRIVGISTQWFEKGQQIRYRSNQHLTNAAISELRQRLSLLVGDELENLRSVHGDLTQCENGNCGCNMLQDSGLPCPFQMSLTRQGDTVWGTMSHPMWRIEVYQNAFRDLNQVSNSSSLLGHTQDTGSSSPLPNQVFWLAEHNEVFHKELDDLIQAHAYDQFVPMAERVRVSPGKKASSRFRSPVEAESAIRKWIRQSLKGRVGCTIKINQIRKLMEDVSNDLQIAFDPDDQKTAKSIFAWFERNQDQILQAENGKN